MGLKPRKIIKDLPTYTPAKTIDSVKREFGFEKVIKLAGNENTLGFSPLAKKALDGVVSYYPDMEVTSLRARISEKFNVKPEQLIFGNGSFELLFLVGLAFMEPDEESIIAEPSFNWYKNVTLIMGGRIVEVPLKDFKVDLDAILNKVTDRTKIIWLCNPNNPTGTIFTQEQLEAFLSKLRRDIIVVLDEAYYDFAVEEGYPDSVKLLKKYDNIIILRTFSKLQGLAFFRLGYGFANEELIGYLNKVRLPINTNGPAQLAALAALDDEVFAGQTFKNVREGLQLYYEVFEKWQIPYVPSNTNFILFDIGADSDKVVEEFLHHGILIRGGREFGYPTMLRVSIGTPEENREVLKLLGKILDKEV